jgi:pyoverdine/dityrosine biosynthesis protein Dit1
MNRLINFIAPYLPDKTAIINKLLDTMPDSTKEIVLDKVIAKQLPEFHLGHKPYKVNPKKGKEAN